MSYWEFLGRPFNLLFLGFAAAAVGTAIAGRRLERDVFPVVAWLGAVAFVGLTLTGAVHDLGLGDPAARFPAILTGSLLVAVPLAWAAAALRGRLFPPVRRVRFGEPGLEGREARVVRRAVERPGSGRAQFHDGDGTLHLIPCHAPGGPVGFGAKVILEEWDDEHASYRVRPR